MDLSSQEVWKGVWQITQRLFKGVWEENNQQNMVMSGVSLSTALAMVTVGARGDTLAQLLAGMALSDISVLQEEYAQILPKLVSDSATILETANSAFVQESFQLLPDFQGSLSKTFQAEFTTLDFSDSHAAANVINNWVEKKTQGKIKDLIAADALSQAVRMVLVNAIYFKSSWLKTFEEYHTRKDAFHVSPGKTVQVEMMYQKETFGLKRTPEADIIDLQYKGGRFSMLVVVPAELFGIDKVDQNIQKNWGDFLQLFQDRSQLQPTKIELYMPKFKVESTLILTDHLRNMDMEHAFSPDKADFSGMTGGKELCIGSVIQKAVIEVNERGSVAAAATAITILTCVMPPVPIPEIRLDRPFLFYIVDKSTGLVLFNGRVGNPSVE